MTDRELAPEAGSALVILGAGEASMTPDATIRLASYKSPQALARKQVIGCAPTGKRGHPVEPSMDRRMSDREIETALLLGKEQVTDHRKIGDRGMLPHREFAVVQMRFEDSQIIVEPLT